MEEKNLIFLAFYDFVTKNRENKCPACLCYIFIYNTLKIYFFTYCHIFSERVDHNRDFDMPILGV